MDIGNLSLFGVTSQKVIHRCLVELIRMVTYLCLTGRDNVSSFITAWLTMTNSSPSFLLIVTNDRLSLLVERDE